MKTMELIDQQIQTDAGTLPQQERPDGSPVASVELDRFCAGCGYNLRTLPVFRDARTGIPVVRCTECGKFQAANDTATALRPWRDRATLLVLAAWMFMLVAVFFHAGFAEGAWSYITLDELTTHSGSTVQRVNNTTIRTWTSSYGPLEVREQFPEDRWFKCLFIGLSFLTACLSGIFAVVVFPHWRRAGYFALVLMLPIVANAIVAISWSYEAPHLFDWGLPYILAHTGLQLLGGVAGILFGRAIARLAVRIALPPSIRPRLAYLWLTDGKPPPRPVRADQPG